MIITKALMQQMILNSGLSNLEINNLIIQKASNIILKNINKQDKLILLYNPNFPIIYNLAKELFSKHNQFTLLTRDETKIDSIPTLSYQTWMDKPFGDVLIDYLFLEPPLDSLHQTLFDTIQQNKIKVISLECNSGLDIDSGFFDKHALKSECTLTLQCFKPAHCLQKNHQLFQKVEIIDLALTPPSSNFEEMNDQRCYALLPKKKIDAYKTSHGQALIIAGSTGMAGAAVLAIKGALSTGLGYLHVGIDASIYPIVASQCISPVFHIHSDESYIQETKVDAIGIGCGCNHLKQFDSIMVSLFQNHQTLVLDGYALRWIAKHLDLLKKYSSPVILTPHLGEFSDLIQKPIEKIKNNLLNEAIAFVKQYPCILVLKGPNTLVVSNQRIYINQTGNAKLAKAGSGDVLCGLITGFVAQRLDCFEACMLAVYLHGKAAECSNQTEWGFLPEMIPEEIEKLLKHLSTASFNQA